MAALVVKSRFAGLQVDVDEYPSTSDAANATKSAKSNTPKKEPTKKSKIVANTKPQQTQQPSLRKKKSKLETVSDEQWEIWKQKDEEINDGHFETELQEAILLSKLDFEEKKDVYKKSKKYADTEKKAQEQKTPEQKSGKKQKKKTVMSLEQFNDMVNGVEDSKNEKTPAPSVKAPTPKDTEFFERVENDAKNEILKEEINERVRNRQASDEFLTRVQFTEALERKNQEIVELKKEIVALKEALLTVKYRNKKLCNILGQAEMRDKAEVLMEVERLRATQEELTAEVSALLSELERERSKNTDPRAKDKKYNSTRKKNIRFDVSSEAMLGKDASTSTG